MGACSATCNGGTQTVSYVCVMNEQTVPNNLCPQPAPPTKQQPCAQVACPVCGDIALEDPDGLAPPATVMLLGTYKREAVLTANGRPVYRHPATLNYLFYHRISADTAFWSISAQYTGTNLLAWNLDDGETPELAQSNWYVNLDQAWQSVPSLVHDCVQCLGPQSELFFNTDSDRCEEPTSCSEGETEVLAPTPTSDRQCMNCNDQCADGTFLVQGSCNVGTPAICTPCHVSCSSCTGSAASQCTACASGLFLSNNCCVFECSAGQVAITELGLCSLCPLGQFDAGAGACTACDAHCAACSGPGSDQCTLCGTGKLLVDGACEDDPQELELLLHAESGEFNLAELLDALRLVLKATTVTPTSLVSGQYQVDMRITACSPAACQTEAAMAATLSDPTVRNFLYNQLGYALTVQASEDGSSSGGSNSLSSKAFPVVVAVSVLVGLIVLVVFFTTVCRRERGDPLAKFKEGLPDEEKGTPEPAAEPVPTAFQSNNVFQQLANMSQAQREALLEQHGFKKPVNEYDLATDDPTATNEEEE